MPRRSKYDSNVGATASVILAERRTNQTALAKAMGVSGAYVSAVMTGKSPPSADWCNLVAQVLELTPQQRLRLHAAAAMDHGFEIDLSGPGDVKP